MSLALIFAHDGPTGLFKPARFGKPPSAVRLSSFLVAPDSGPIIFMHGSDLIGLSV